MEHNEIKHIPAEKIETKGSNGFVFSIHQICGFVTRKRRLKQANVAESNRNDIRHGKNPGNKPPLSRAA